jgi:hypothetical protein
MPNCLENEFLSLTFQDDGTLRLENRASGTTRAWRWPGFRLGLRGEVLEGSEFAVAELACGGGEVRARLHHPASGLSAQVRYWVAAGEPWFRKRVALQAPPGTPSPNRLWVDVQDAPAFCRRVGYGIRGRCGEVEGLQTYSGQPGCGYPVHADDWFVGLESPTGFALPVQEELQLFQHPAWSADGSLTSFPAVFGVAASHEAAPEAFADYLWRIRRPRLERPFTHITVGWSSKYVDDGDYVDTFEGREAFVRALLDLNLRPKAVGIDAGWFDRHSMYQGKGDDEHDTRLLGFRDLLRDHGLELAIWLSHNGPVGFDLDWIQRQGWEIGEGASPTYGSGQYVVMMQPTFEEALTQRWERLVGEVGATHLKMDWDNECASNPNFAERYPTIDHVREETVNAFHRIGARLHKKNPAVKLRHGWWPSPWWLTYADHVWLVDSGDCESEAWPSRSTRDRDATHRDTMYYHLQRTSETPVPLDAYDNHGFAAALCNCFTTEPHTWLNTCVLSALRGTTYIHYPFTPEGLRDWQVATFQQVLDWWDWHADELGQRGTRIVLGRPWEGEVYGFWHPHARGGWLLLRNPSVEPQAVQLPLSDWLVQEPGTARQVFPCWRQLRPPWDLWLTGQEVAVLEVSREPLADPAPFPGLEYMLSQTDGRALFRFPCTQTLSEAIRPLVHPDMQIPELWAEALPETAIGDGRRLQWFVGVPHRTEHAELLVTLRGPEEVLDGLQLRAGTSRYRGDVIRDPSAVTRVFRGTRGYGGERVLPPLGPRDRDDYVMAVPDGGFTGLTVEITGPRPDEVQIGAWLTGFEGLSRRGQAVAGEAVAGPLLPPHPYGFPRLLRLL